MSKNLFNKVWDLHTVTKLDSGQTQLFVGLHLIHEVTSPQAFQMLRERNLEVLYPERTFATVDHIVPTTSVKRPYTDSLAEEMIEAIESNTNEFGIRFFSVESGEQGIVHVIGPELGLTQPGMIVTCGDSHTATHGAFGAIAFGIGTSQVRDVLATQSIMMNKMKVRKISVNGTLGNGIYAKDIIIKIIEKLGVNGGIGHAYEYAGTAIDQLNMEERMTICNMSIEGGARCGYVNPDQTTFDYIKGRKYAPKGEAFDSAVSFWESIASDSDAHFDAEVTFDAEEIEPMVTWGINPGQAIPVLQKMPRLDNLDINERETAELAYKHMGFDEGQAIKGVSIDVAFIGSCTNSRISDLREAARIVEGNKVNPNVQALVVPGSIKVKEQAVEEGLDKIFSDAGFEWREAGCSMCLAMNPDKLQGRELSASSSNRNFIGRQGSPVGRTLLMSPAMVAAAALQGEVVDVREF